MYKTYEKKKEILKFRNNFLQRLNKNDEQIIYLNKVFFYFILGWTNEKWC